MSTLQIVRDQISSILNTSALYDGEIDAGIANAARSIERNYDLPYMRQRADLITTDETILDGLSVAPNSRKFPVFSSSTDWRGLTPADYRNGMPIPPQVKHFESVKLLNEAGDTHIRDLKRTVYEDLPNVFEESDSPSHYWVDRVGPREGGSASSTGQRLWLGLWPAAKTDNFILRIQSYVFTDPFPSLDADPHWLFRNERLLLIAETIVNHVAPLVRDGGLYQTYKDIRMEEVKKVHRWTEELKGSDLDEKLGMDQWGP